MSAANPKVAQHLRATTLDDPAGAHSHEEA